MREQEPEEKRIDYLVAVLNEFMNQNGIAAECTVIYDGVECDGYCLAEDFRIAADMDL